MPGRKVEIGRIDLREKVSYFEVDKGEAQRVVDSMNQYEVDGRPIFVELTRGNDSANEGKGRRKERKTEQPSSRGGASRRPGREKPWRQASSRRKNRGRS